MPVQRVVVVVPAHDEEAWIGRCLDALQAAARAYDRPVVVRVVLDACHDRTAELLPDWVEPVVVSHRNVGAARAAGLADLTPLPGDWYATTDADSVVPPTWFTAQAASARQHDLFVGTVRVIDQSLRSREGLSRHALEYRDHDGHRHVHGANLGVSAAAYHRLGGFSAQVAHEDRDLVDRAIRAGLRIDWSGRAPVATSARRSHRVPEGFSTTLDLLEDPA